MGLFYGENINYRVIIDLLVPSDWNEIFIRITKKYIKIRDILLFLKINL